MSSDSMVAAANLCQAAIPLLSLLAYIPQWIKIIRIRSSASNSVRAWFLWTITSGFALFYAIVQLSLTGHGLVLVVSTCLTMLFVVFTLVLVLCYRSGKPA